MLEVVTRPKIIDLSDRAIFITASFSRFADISNFQAVENESAQKIKIFVPIDRKSNLEQKTIRNMGLIIILSKVISVLKSRMMTSSNRPTNLNYALNHDRIDVVSSSIPLKWSESNFLKD